MERKDLVVLIEAGYIYLGMQRFKEASEVFEGLCVLSPESEVPMVALGSVAFCQGDFSKAMTHYRKALTIDPKSLFAKVYLGEAMFFSGKRNEAMDLLVEVHDADPTGAAGGFAKALLDAIHHGFTPTLASKKKGHDAGKKVSH